VDIEPVIELKRQAVAANTLIKEWWPEAAKRALGISAKRQGVEIESTKTESGDRVYSVFKFTSTGRLCVPIMPGKFGSIS
jgi:hypothetical protein